IVGIRAGEKLHEVLVSADESRHTVELADMFVIQPEQPFWDFKPWEGKTPAEGFLYASDANTQWLTVEQMRSFIAP
ncbi:MAG: polysaccharide biosynthesis protein, partial [Candidatus Peribacteraceae bacterium]|nr:polysaccharide biosynthesis protein [Candidatus Peribacteraceae bacterium]